MSCEIEFIQHLGECTMVVECIAGIGHRVSFWYNYSFAHPVCGRSSFGISGFVLRYKLLKNSSALICVCKGA